MNFGNVSAEFGLTVIAPLRAGVRETWRILGLGDAVAESTRKLRGYQFACWERCTNDPAVESISTETIREFQRAATAGALAPETIESILNGVYSVLTRATSV